MMTGSQKNWVAIGDVTVTKVGARWDVYVAGHWHLCRASEERTVFEVAAAFAQLRHDEAGYGENPSAFVERVGVRYVCDRIIFDLEARNTLVARFMREHSPRRSITRADDIVLALLGEARARAS